MIKQALNILGTEYTLCLATEQEDPKLKRIDGYCDKTSKRLVVAEKADDSDLDDFAVYQRKCIRHEIIHAFLIESGLHENFTHPEYGHDETYVDWIAAQWPKMAAVFKEAGCDG